MSEMINRTFIQFLKDNHAFTEYKQEIVQQNSYDTNYDTVMEDIEKGLDAECLLEDKFYFYWEDAVTSIVWSELNEKWLKILAEKYNIGA